MVECRYCGQIMAVTSKGNLCEECGHTEFTERYSGLGGSPEKVILCRCDYCRSGEYDDSDGRLFDARIAERVMKWRRHGNSNHWLSPTLKSQKPVRCPDFSTKGTDNRSLIRQLVFRDGFTFQETTRSRGRYTSEFRRDGKAFRGIGKSQLIATCKAALLAAAYRDSD